MKLSVFDIVGFSVGFVIMVFFLYRLSPTSIAGKKAIMGIVLQAGPLVLAFIGLAVAAYWSGGTKYLNDGFVATFKTTASFMPTIAVLFPVMAIGGVLALHHKESMSQMLLGRSGYPGTLGVAFLVPSGNVMADVIKQFWETPALRPMILYFLTSVALVCWTTFLFRVLGLTWEIGTKMYVANWCVAIGILPFFWFWSRAIAVGGFGRAILSIFGL